MNYFDDLDSKYMYDEKINNCVFEIYMDIIKSTIDGKISDEEIGLLAERYQERLKDFNEEEQAYIKANVKWALMGPANDIDETIKR